MSLINKVVIITGAASGIGEGIATHFAKLSARLALIDIDVDKLRKVAEQCENLSKAKVLGVPADVSKDGDVKRAISDIKHEYGKIDVVINCAGIAGYNRNILDADLLSEFDKVISVNLRAMVAVTHYAAPALIESKGCIVNIASVMARMSCKSAISYNISKAGVAHFTRNAALDFADKGVRVNSISPGPVETNLLINSGSNQVENAKTWETLAKTTPLQRNVHVMEIAAMAAYLASDQAKGITGSDFIIDCGFILSGTVNATFLRNDGHQK
ncbi:uncharacterized oxidoreductase YxbG-like [Bicyclus anynana]|uniref:Uncharacterized oxidoreductase YxbG-like n=1 Tax=Bicyclus anynana TaxID=110368 RepID=A0A6J1P0S6_BICAN|nr:uncharacterized oxidoreductase YxbG-like [Bicyclus anynana]